MAVVETLERSYYFYEINNKSEKGTFTLDSSYKEMSHLRYLTMCSKNERYCNVHRSCNTFRNLERKVFPAGRQQHCSYISVSLLLRYIITCHVL